MESNGLFVTATDTEVGKTHVAGMLSAALADKFGGDRLDVWKPVQSGTSLGDELADSRVLQQWSGLPGGEAARVTHTFAHPLAPWMAARREGRDVDYEALVEEGRRRLRQAYTLVEGAGGLAVPLMAGKLMADLARDLRLPALIVARPYLGTVNHTLLTVAFARQAGLRVAGVVLNGVRDEEERAVAENIEMIETFGEVEVLGTLPWVEQGTLTASEWVRLFRRRIRWERLADSQFFTNH